MKIRGYSVNLAEVESALRRVRGVREAVVVDREDRPGDRRLVAYVVASASPPPTVTEMRRALSATLADHMLPAAFVLVDAIPRNALNKLDRRALPPPTTTRPRLETPMVAPRTPAEAALARIWAEVLRVDEVGIHDDFFDLGGHSLLAAQVLARVHETLDTELDPRALFELPTVAQLAGRLIDQRMRAMDPADLARLVDQLPETAG